MPNGARFYVTNKLERFVVRSEETGPFFAKLFQVLPRAQGHTVERIRGTVNRNIRFFADQFRNTP